MTFTIWLSLYFKGERDANREFEAVVFIRPWMKSEKLAGQHTIRAISLNVSLFY